MNKAGLYFLLLIIAILLAVIAYLYFVKPSPSAPSVPVPQGEVNNFLVGRVYSGTMMSFPCFVNRNVFNVELSINFVNNTNGVLNMSSDVKQKCGNNSIDESGRIDFTYTILPNKDVRIDHLDPALQQGYIKYVSDSVYKVMDKNMEVGTITRVS